MYSKGVSFSQKILYKIVDINLKKKNNPNEKLSSETMLFDQLIDLLLP